MKLLPDIREHFYNIKKQNWTNNDINKSNNVKILTFIINNISIFIYFYSI